VAGPLSAAAAAALRVAVAVADSAGHPAARAAGRWSAPAAGAGASSGWRRRGTMRARRGTNFFSASRCSVWLV
jgi:hypothetical protein